MKAKVAGEMEEVLGGFISEIYLLCINTISKFYK